MLGLRGARVAGRIAELRRIQARFRKAVEDDATQQMVLENHHLHEAIGRIAKNAYLTPSLNRLLIDHTRISQTFYRPRFQGERRRIEDACRHHDALIDAIEARECEQAVEITQAHWDLSRDQMELYIRPAPLVADMPEHQEESSNAI